MKITSNLVEIFQRSINEYHIKDSVDQSFENRFSKDQVFESMMYKKAWIDTVQWHLEDIIRKPSIDPKEALVIKRRIDKSNQDRTDMVEKIDDYFFQKFKDITSSNDAILNTETPAWAIDRLSILELKTYHMRIESERESADESHKLNCLDKLNVLLLQRENLSTAIDQLLTNISKGKVKAVTYKQMKMYNDKKLNPELYK
ncbi:MAG: DUF4254 domain-containing protein [Flavobacteriales bacterium]|nr:MAG: DUF4254 domain-containing protein [Flavobacteriales bacterium]